MFCHCAGVAEVSWDEVRGDDARAFAGRARAARFFSALLVALSAGALAGCGSAPLAETPAKLPEARALGPDAETYTLDGTEVSLEADVHAMTDHTIRFGAIAGTFGVTPSDPLSSNVDVTVQTGSASATLGVVADVAKSGDFLDVGAYPTARFVSRAFEKAKGAPGKIDLVGELELHGTKRPVRVPASLAVDACTIRFSTEFAINRRQYHVESQGSLDGVVSDGVTVRIHAEVPRRDRPASCGPDRRAKGEAPRRASPEAPTSAG